MFKKNRAHVLRLTHTALGSSYAGWYRYLTLMIWVIPQTSVTHRVMYVLTYLQHWGLYFHHHGIKVCILNRGRWYIDVWKVMINVTINAESFIVKCISIVFDRLGITTIVQLVGFQEKIYFFLRDYYGK